MISADLSRSRTVGELARQFAVSESSVKNYFRGVYGQSIAQYLQQRRMEQAAALLSSTRLPVVEVAAQVGYESQSKFSAGSTAPLPWNTAAPGTSPPQTQKTARKRRNGRLPGGFVSKGQSLAMSRFFPVSPT